jgi:hypothetical protein
VRGGDGKPRFEAQTAAVGALKQRASEYPMFDLRSDEDMIAGPKNTLKRLFDFLEVPCTDEFIATCASIVYTKPHKSRYPSSPQCRSRDVSCARVALMKLWFTRYRNEFEWRDEDKQRIADLIAKTEWFSGYTFDS